MEMHAIQSKQASMSSGCIVDQLGSNRGADIELVSGVHSIKEESTCLKDNGALFVAQNSSHV